jgi:N-acetylmuramoyl-L-alanine amidase
MALFNYLGGASVCMALCYTLYLLMFRRLTFFSMNRFYLLSIVAVSLIIPALHIKIRGSLPVKAINQSVVISHNTYPEVAQFASGMKAPTSVNWYFIVQVIYIIVCAGMLFKIAYDILEIRKEVKLHGEWIGKNQIVRNEYGKNASFFHIIFIANKSADYLEMEQIMAHEKMHARLYHSADNLFIEVVKAFFWFNPFIYLIAKALSEVHEFEVDSALKKVFDPKRYASLLLRLSSPPSMHIANQFSAYSLKKRISMLFKPGSPAFKQWRYLAIIPVLLISGYWFSIEKIYGKDLMKKDFVLVLDAGHGGSQIGAIGSGGYREKDLCLQIVNQINQVAGERGVRTILTRKDDRYLDLPGRVTNEADAFISIHLNAPGTWTRHTNGMEIIVEKNALYSSSGRLATGVKSALQQLDEVNATNGIEITETSPDNTLYVLRHNKVPAILIELGFMTDHKDLDYVRDRHNQREIAEKIIDAVVAYGNSN